MKYLEKWWGWGELDKVYPKDLTSHIHNILKERFHLSSHHSAIPQEEKIELPTSRLSTTDFEDLKNISSSATEDHKTRLCHSLGKSYIDLIEARKLKRFYAPDAVVFPTSVEEIVHVLQFCKTRKISLVPFGGGSSVLGGVSPEKKEDHQAVITLNLQKMKQIFEINPLSNTVHTQTGILGPALEKELNQKGFTLGHFPQSFEFSSVGGWIATRSAGQNSTFYGKIEDMVVALKILTPQGLIQTKTVPASSCGPSFKDFFIGSEGCFGIIVEATLKIHPLPQHKTYQSFLFPDFLQGIRALSHIKKLNLSPSLVRLSDAKETEFLFKMESLKKDFFHLFQKKFFSFLLKKKKINLGRASLLLIGLEGSHKEIRYLKKQLKMLAKNTLSLGSRPGWKWHKSRFELPYLRDALIDQGVMIETFETATEWHNIENLYRKVYDTTHTILGPKALVFCHISHIYLTGASLYFTFLTQAKNDPILQWHQVKERVTKTLLQEGGTLSHHHGIGRDHKKFLIEEHGPLFVETLKEVKHFLDPQHILNPGKLIE
ncbi:MAG: FAD-binding oxidoreductase [Deltaproteobacteria bacterium]|nr:FAD-binding oxidoreductase [Deltaproteobacteria bacterium]